MKALIVVGVVVVGLVGSALSDDDTTAPEASEQPLASPVEASMSGTALAWRTWNDTVPGDYLTLEEFVLLGAVACDEMQAGARPSEVRESLLLDRDGTTILATIIRDTPEACGA